MNRSIAPFLLALLVVSPLACDKKSDAPSTSSEGSKKTTKSDESDDDDSPTKKTKKEKEKAKSDDDDDDKPSKEAKEKPTLPDKKTVSSSIASFFAAYKAGAKFEFYSDYFAPSVEKFISMKDTTPEAMAKESRAFYGGKTEIAYTPKLSTLTVVPNDAGDRETATVEVTEAWKYPPPKTWGTMDGQLVTHVHTTSVEIVVGADGKWISYAEPKLQRDNYKVVAPDGTLGIWPSPGDVENEDDKAPAKVTKGTIVQDAFETLVVDMNAKGEVMARKIHHDGKDGWALDHSAVAVENPNGGTSAGEETYLEKVGK